MECRPGSREEGGTHGSRGPRVGSLLGWAHGVIGKGRRMGWENRQGAPLLPQGPDSRAHFLVTHRSWPRRRKERPGAPSSLEPAQVRRLLGCLPETPRRPGL